MYGKENVSTMENKKLFYAISAVVLALILLIAAVSAEGSLGGLFRKAPEPEITVENLTGDVSIRRNGSVYTLKNGMELLPGDTVLVGRSAGCEVVAAGCVRATLAMDAQLRIAAVSDDLLTLEVEQGAAFFDMVQAAGTRTVALLAGPGTVTPESGAVLSLEAYTGSQTLNVYSGAASLVYRDETVALASGSQAALVQTEDDAVCTKSEICAPDLMPFLLRELMDRGGLCFKVDALQGILEDRQAHALVSTPHLTEERMTCTVEIRCDAALGYEGKTQAGISDDGMILPATPVKFTRGESAYDVLRRVCRAAGIEMDYNFTVIFGGYYITQIGPLRESDCGPGSGWLYTVNGWFPNYGASMYEVEPGDVIVWQYTLDGSAVE